MDDQASSSTQHAGNRSGAGEGNREQPTGTGDAPRSGAPPALGLSKDKISPLPMKKAVDGADIGEAKRLRRLYKTR